MATLLVGCRAAAAAAENKDGDEDEDDGCDCACAGGVENRRVDDRCLGSGRHCSLRIISIVIFITLTQVILVYQNDVIASRHVCDGYACSVHVI